MFRKTRAVLSHVFSFVFIVAQMSRAVAELRIASSSDFIMMQPLFIRITVRDASVIAFNYSEGSKNSSKMGHKIKPIFSSSMQATTIVMFLVTRDYTFCATQGDIYEGVLPWLIRHVRKALTQ